LTKSQVYVDALGPTKQYEQFLSSQFPGINFTVTAKADSKYTIVGAASVAAKVTRDAWIEGWTFEEDAQQDTLEAQLNEPGLPNSGVAIHQVLILSFFPSSRGG
jgi:ribonuclease H2 subunit A